MIFASVLPLGALLGLPTAFIEVEATEEQELSTLFPAECLFFAESKALGAFFEEGLEHPFLVALLESELGSTLLEASEHDIDDFLAMSELVLGHPLLDSLASVTAEGVAFGLEKTADGAVQAGLVLRGDDEALLDDLRAKLLLFAAGEGTKVKALADFHGAHVWRLGKESILAQRGRLVVLANTEELVRTLLVSAEAEQDGSGGAKGLLGRESFAAANAARSGDELLWVWADLERAREIEYEGPLAELAKIERNPQALIFLGAGLCSLAGSETLAMEARVADTSLRLVLQGDHAGSAQRLLPGERPEGPGGSSRRFERPAPIALENQVGQALLYRDFMTLFQDRAELFAPEILPRFSRFNSELGVFFAGKDLGEEILPALSPWIRLVSAPLTYDEAAEPEIPLPGLAIVTELAAPEVNGPEFVSAFQTILAIMNVEQGQQGQSALTMRLAEEDGVPITVGRYPRPQPDDGVDLRYNLQPAFAVVDQFLVLGTHEDLVRRVIRHLRSSATKAKGTKAVRDLQDELQLEGRILQDIIEQNFDAIVMQKVLNEGATFEKATEEIQGLRLLLASIAEARTTVQNNGVGGHEWIIDLRVATGTKESR